MLCTFFVGFEVLAAVPDVLEDISPAVALTAFVSAWLGPLRANGFHSQLGVNRDVVLALFGIEGRVPGLVLAVGLIWPAAVAPLTTGVVDTVRVAVLVGVMLRAIPPRRLPTRVVLVAIENVEVLDRTVRALRIEAWEGEVLSRCVGPETLGLVVAISLSLSLGSKSLLPAESLDAL